MRRRDLQLGRGASNPARPAVVPYHAEKDALIFTGSCVSRRGQARREGRNVMLIMMAKTLILLMAGAVILSAALPGCANEAQTVRPTNTAANPGDRSYTASDLEMTGRRDVGTAAAARDASVGVSNGR